MSIRVASVLCWINGIGFGVFCPPAMWSISTGRGIPMVMGFPAYGRGRFERMGLQTTVPLLAGFLFVCACECAAGWLLWGGHRSGAVLALGLLPFGAVFWWGFSLPYGPLVAAASTGLILAGWKGLH